MASFVTEVLSSTGKLGKDDLSAKINKLSQRVDDVKNEVQETLDSRYLTFFPCLAETLELSNRVTTATGEIELLRKRIDSEIKGELQISTNEMQDLSGNLIQVSITLQIVEKLLKIHQRLEAIGEHLVRKEYLRAAVNLDRVQRMLKEPSTPCEKQILIFQALKTESVIRREKLIYDLGEIWNEHVAWCLNDKTAPRIELRIFVTSREKMNELTSLLQAMQFMNYLNQKIKAFATYFMHHVCKFIITQNARVAINKNSAFTELELTKNKFIDKQPSPSEVFANLKSAFQFLSESIFSIEIDIDDDKKTTLLAKLGQTMSEEFCNFLIKECLSLAIPAKKDDLEHYHQIIEETTAFQDYLIEINFLDSNQVSVLEYARNVDVLFANKLCQDVLERARKLMLHELHETVQLTATDLPTACALVAAKSDRKSLCKPDLDLRTPERKLDSVFIFPTCKISKSIQQLMGLVYEILNEAISSSPMCAVRLFYTIRNVFELFCNVMPIYHKENLTMLPQVAALHHNNCLYVAHHLMTLGHQFSKHMAIQMTETFTTFIDFLPVVRAMGSETFLSQMLFQKKQMLDIVREIGGFHNMATDANFMSSLERCLKQCLHQLSHLQRVWQDVLPTNVYYQAMGTLTNSVIEELLGQMTSQEDIPSQCTTDLISAFNLLIDRTQPLFQSESESGSASSDVCRYVPKWMKLKELLLVLAASMNDIMERWAEGKGPLAHEFTANEIKQLIRALFQNTSRRSAVLANIK